MVDAKKSSGVVKSTDQKAEEVTFTSRIKRAIKIIREYGAEERNDPNFSWSRYFIRALVTNLIAAVIAYIIMREVMGSDLADSLPADSKKAAPKPFTPDDEF
jgi:K+-transporting ATPase A subunit